MSLGVGIRGSTSAFRNRPLCPACRLPLRFPSSPFSPSPSSPIRARYAHTGPPGQQVQRYLEQARQSIQAALRILREHSGKLSASAGTQVAQLGTRLNHVTGYEDIDRLKASVVQTEQELSAAREASRSLKQAYDAAVATRASAQRSVNSLLERKDRWSDSDVADFTSLIRSDHASNAAVTQTSAQLNAAEANVDRLFSELTKSILTRYHEEQIWSDKIRSFSSWASLVGLAANLVVFMGAIVFVEPWKRRKLAEGLEVRMAGMMASVQAQIETLAEEVGAANLGAGLSTPDTLPVAVIQPPPPASQDLGSTGTTLSPDILPSPSTDYSAYLSANLTRCYRYLGGGESARITIDPAYLAGASGLALGAALTYTMR